MSVSVTFYSFDYISAYPRSINMTDEEKTRLDALSEAITLDERTTIPAGDIPALHAEIARLTEKLQRHRQRLIVISGSLNATCAIIDSLLIDT
jgi:hypothetical protein